MRRLWEASGSTTAVASRCARRDCTADRPFPPLLGAAVTEETARWMGAGPMPDHHQPATGAVAACGGGVRTGRWQGQADVPAGQAPYARAEQAALEGAMEQWSANVATELAEGLTSLSSSRHRPGRSVPRSCASTCMSRRILASTGLAAGTAVTGLRSHLPAQREPREDRFIDDFAEHVLPALRTQAPSAASHA